MAVGMGVSVADGVAVGGGASVSVGVGVARGVSLGASVGVSVGAGVSLAGAVGVAVTIAAGMNPAGFVSVMASGVLVGGVVKPASATAAGVAVAVDSVTSGRPTCKPLIAASNTAAKRSVSWSAAARPIR